MLESSNKESQGRREDKGRRVTIDLTSAAAREVDRLRDLTGLSTADLFRHALSLFRVFVEAKGRGHEIRIQDPATPDVTTRLELPILLEGGK